MHSNQSLRSINQTILLAVILLLSVRVLAAQIPIHPRVESLPTDKPRELNIGADEMCPCQVNLSSGEFFQVRVEQFEVDVLLRLLDASRNEVARMSLPRSYQSELMLTFVAPASGNYRLEVASSDANITRGKYAIRREISRVATAQDRRRVEVERIFAEGMTARATSGQAEIATQKFTAARAGWLELADSRMANIANLLNVQSQARATFVEARKLVDENSVESNRQALTKFEKASKLFDEGGELDKQGAALIGAALAASNLNNPRIVIDFLKQALARFATPQDKPHRADLLLQIVKFSLSIGDDNSALEHLLLARPIYVDLGLRQEAAVVTMTIGAYYYKFGDNRRAYEFLTSALPFRKVLGDKCNEVELLVNLGAASLALDRKAEAIKLLNEEVPALTGTQGGCEAQKAVGWNNLGKAYYKLGEYGLAISKYTEALGFSKDNAIRADTHLNLGAAYFDSGRYDKALMAYTQASSLYRDASAQIKVDLDILKLTPSQPQIQQLQNGLKFRHDLDDKSGEAKTLVRLSEVYLKLNKKPEALAASQQALLLYGALTDLSGEAMALGSAMRVWRFLGNRRLAIFFGKQSLNKIQELRGAARGIEINIQKNYLRTFKDSYQQLSELLIEEDLLEQAVQVLSLYRDEEFFDFNLDSNVSVERVYLSTSESNFAQRYEAESSKLRDLGLQITELKRQAANRRAGVAETGNLARLEAEFQEAATAFAVVFKDAASRLRQSAGNEAEDKRLRDVTELRASLGVLGAAPRQKAVSLYLLAADETFYVLLMTPEGVKAFSYPIKARALNDNVTSLLTVLSCPEFDPFREAVALYDIVFKSTSTRDRQTTLEAELERYKPNLLLWSMGEPLDIVPMAALYDARAKQFLVAKYQHAVFTRARPDRISREPKSWINGIGFGAAKEYSGYGPLLRGVRESLSIIFNDQLTGRKGIINGPALIDDQFKLAELENLNGKWPLVHIASHFDYHPGDSDNSALLLGDGTRFSLAEMQKRKTLFAGVELLMLSACKTSVRESNSYRKEMEGLAELAQRLGANSVVATLWNVYDAATPGREIAFYRLYRDHPDWSKSELLQQSQLNLLYGKVGTEPKNQASRTGTTERNEEKEGCVNARKPRKRFTPDPKAPLAHPYYWAPFVLYGTSR